MLFAISKTKELPANCNLRNIHQQFGNATTGEQHTGRQRSDSAEPYASGFPRSNFSQKNRSFPSGKRGFYPCFCLPACCNCPVALSEFVTCFIKIINCELVSFKKCNCIRKTCCKSNLLRKCGLLAHTSPTFLKNCWIKKLLVACGLSQENHLHTVRQGWGTSPACLGNRNCP